jgi:hypothetical protein
MPAARLEHHRREQDDPDQGGRQSRRPFCRWGTRTTVDNNGNVSGFSVEIDIRDSQGISQLYSAAGFTVKAKTIGKHQGAEARDTGDDTCVVAMVVTNTSRVDVQANTSQADQSTSCQLAEQFAADIEPQLPGGSS